MAFKTYSRLIYATLESTEGTVASFSNTDDFIEVIDPTFTFTNRVVERNPTRNSITPAVQHVGGTGTSSGEISSQVEISFTVEMAGSGTAATAPRWSRLLQACGMTEVTSLARVPLGNLTGATPAALLHKENISAQAGTTYASGTNIGRVIGDTHYDDGEVFLHKPGTPPATAASANNVVGETSGVRGVASGNQANSGVAWILGSGLELGSTDNSSLTIHFPFELTETGANNTGFIACGCRGNVEFAFVSGDRVLMNFTFIGKVDSYFNNKTLNPIAEGREIPPAFMGVNLAIGDSSYGNANAASFTDSVFSQMTLNLNNDLVLRDGASYDGGFYATYITGRNPSLTIDVDSVEDTDYDFWDRFLSGETMHGKMTIGGTSGNKFLVKFPAAQISNLGDGNRDEVMVYDINAALTGGDYGSSVRSDYDSTDTTDGADIQMNPRNGTDNEFVLYHL